MMSDRQYYSERKADNPKVRLSFSTLADYFFDIHTKYYIKRYFYLVPSGSEKELTLFSMEKFNKDYMLPYYRNPNYRLDDIFDFIEFFYDYIEIPPKLSGNKSGSIRFPIGSQPTNTFIQETNEPTKEEVKEEYRKDVNRVISKFGAGYELTENGYIREVMNNGLEVLVDSPQVLPEDRDSEYRIKYAKETFFKHGATEGDKRSAIIEVGAVLEKLRDLKQLSLNKKDEGELFTVLNSFSIRHNRKDQKLDYDKDIFYPWMFYNLLAAVDASLKLQKKKDGN